MPDGLGRRPADGRDEVAVRPERRQLALQLRELGAQVMAGPAFDALYGPVDAELGVDRDEHVHAVGHDLDFPYLEIELFRNLVRDLLEAGVDAVHEHLSAVFRAEDHMVVAAPDYVVVASVSIHTNSIPLAAVYVYRLTPMRLISPYLKKGVLRRF